MASAPSEFDDSALAKEFGRHGAGVFIGPAVLAREIAKQYNVKALGIAAEVLDELFAAPPSSRSP